MPGSLTESELVELQRELSCWTYDAIRRAFHRSFHVDGFLKAVGLMTDVALEADSGDSRPEWLVVHNRVDVWLITEGIEGVSASDLVLARHIEFIAKRRACFRRTGQ
jgi:4a-hydroxytetrahydrobiopterin dehydratase